MKLIQELSALREANENAFYVVDEPLTVFVHDKYVGTGHHVASGAGGTSQLHRMTYKELSLDDGDEIHSLVGGMFFVIDGESKAQEGVLVKPSDKSPFEKSHSGYSNPNHEKLKKLVDDGKITKISSAEKTSVKYR